MSVVAVTLLPLPVILLCFDDSDNRVCNGGAVDGDGGYDCCAYTWILLIHIAKTSILAIAENIEKVNLV